MNARTLSMWLSSAFLLLASVLAVGGQPNDEPRQVSVAQPLARQITPAEDFTGRLAATNVEIRPRVTGHVVRVLFKDGADVKRGELLVEIDPRPYQAELARTEAELVLAETRLKRADMEARRAALLLEKKVISREEFDKITADRAEAEAKLRVVSASLEVAKIKLDFTRVTAPMDGRAGRSLLAHGSIAKADETLLTTIVGKEPLHVYFDVDERTLLRMWRTVKREGKLALAVAVGLADENNFPRRGVIDFVDNRVDEKTGKLRVRAVLAGADRAILPGMFVRVRVTTGEPYEALLAPEKSLLKMDGQAYLYVVNEKNMVERRPVELGPRHENLRVVEQGVRAADWVVVDAPKKLEPGSLVKPRRVELTDPKKAPQKSPPAEK